MVKYYVIVTPFQVKTAVCLVDKGRGRGHKAFEYWVLSVSIDLIFIITIIITTYCDKRNQRRNTFSAPPPTQLLFHLMRKRLFDLKRPLAVPFTVMSCTLAFFSQSAEETLSDIRIFYFFCCFCGRSWEKERLLLVFPFSFGSESSIASSYKCFVLEPSEEDQERESVICSSKVLVVADNYE